MITYDHRAGATFERPGPVETQGITAQAYGIMAYEPPDHAMERVGYIGSPIAAGLVPPGLYCIKLSGTLYNKASSDHCMRNRPELAHVS